MQTVRYDDLPALRDRIGDGFGPWSPPVQVTRELIEQFAEMTGDRQWIHVDMERARRESPLGTTIAHGFLVLSLSTMLKNSIGLTVTGHRDALNYGLDRVRFLMPMPADSWVYGRTRLTDAAPRDNGTLLTQSVAIHVVGQDRPAVVFDWKILYRA
jgi:acyl dehydratase